MEETLSIDKAFIKKLTDIVLANMANENFGAEELAKEAGMSRSNLYRRLRSIKGMDISQFIREIRLFHAMQMLQTNQGTASEIAFRVGFGSPAYFNRCFHEQYGYTPGEVRKRSTEGLEKNKPDKENNEGGVYKSEKDRKIRSIFTGREYIYALITLSGIVIGLLVIYFIIHSITPSPGKSIVILPFECSNDTDCWRIAAIRDGINNNIQVIAGLRIVPRYSADKYNDPARYSLRDIGKDLNVNYAVYGEGQIDGNKISLYVELNSVKNARNIWTHTYIQELNKTEDIVSLHNRITKDILTQIKVEIQPEEKQIIEKLPTVNLHALTSYQKGMTDLNRFVPDLSNRLNQQIRSNNYRVLISARKMFEEALRDDSTFAPAYSGLAKTLKNLRVKRDSVLMFVEKALSYDNQLYDAWLLKGFYASDSSMGLEYLNEALKINPNSWEVYYEKGNKFNDPLQKIINYHKAASLNRGPEYPDILFQLARTYRYAGFYKESDEIALEALKVNSDTVQYLTNLIACESNKGNKSSVFTALKRAYAIDSTNDIILPQFGNYFLHLQNWEESIIYYKKNNALQKITPILRDMFFGYAYLKNGNRREADSIFDAIKWIKKYPQFHSFNIACLYAIRGEKEKVYEYLNRFLDDKMNPAQSVENYYVYYLKHTPWFDDIRNEPEFKKVVTEIDSMFQVQHERVRKGLREHGIAIDED